METQPVLAAPGAGIPWSQRLLARFYLKPFVANQTPWEVSAGRFPRIVEMIRAQIADLTDEQLRTRVLVPPLPGLEDSSRYWSIAMTLDHIVIASRKMALLIKELDAGRVPALKTDIAKLKPSGELPLDVIRQNFDQFCDQEFGQILPSLQNRNSTLKFKHPWFGPMSAQAWYWLLPTHLRIHAKQIEEICKLLPPL